MYLVLSEKIVVMILMILIRMKPILAYSHKGAFVTENIPANILGFLASYVAEMNRLDINNALPKTYYAPATRTYPSAITPLLGDIMYNQGAPYSDKCPDKYVTGCVATAMAQVMKYYEYPTTGKGSHSYTTGTDGLKCSFDFSTTTFDWANMLNQYVSGEYTDAQADAVATLMYACGVSVDMDYTADESGANAFKIATSLNTYFDYDSNAAYIQRSFFEYEEWMNLIKNELSNGRPVLYDGVSSEGGHEFVFDGYDANDMVHVNWGWAGANDGYFEISKLDPSSPGIGGGTNLGGGFTNSQGMTIGIQKPSSSSVYTSYFYCSEMTVSATSFATGSSFQPSVKDIINMSTPFDGEAAIILDINGTQNVISSIYTFPQTMYSQTGYEQLTWNAFNFPTEYGDGTYLLYAATRNPSKNTTWDQVRGVMGADYKYYCTIADGQVTLTPYWGDNIDVSATLDVTHALYSGKTGNFTLTYQNNSSSRYYYGNISIALIQDDKIVSLLSTNEIFMTPSQAATSVEIATTIDSSISTGDYQVCPIATWGSGYVALGNTVDVTLNAYSGTATLDIKSINLAEATVDENSDITIIAELEATGDAPIYDNAIEALVATSALVDVCSHSQYVFFNVGEPYELTMTFNPKLSAGSYVVVLFVDNEQVTYPIDFTVKSGTGIKDNVVEGVIVYPQPAGEVLNVRAPIDVNMAEIYNVTGQLLKKEYLVGSGTEFSLPIGQLASGTYILMLHTNDKVYRQKFVK